MILNAPHPLNDPSRPTLETNFVPNTTTTSTSAQNSEVNVVQSSSSQQPGGKNTKGKSNKYSNEWDNPKSTDTQLERKPKFPYMICEEDHYMKDCPHREVVAKYMKVIFQSVQQQHLIAQTLSLRKEAIKVISTMGILPQAPLRFTCLRRLMSQLM